MQLLLIQTQVMKVDMESALLQMDQIMRANRLNFSLMAGALVMMGNVEFPFRFEQRNSHDDPDKSYSNDSNNNYSNDPNKSCSILTTLLLGWHAGSFDIPGAGLSCSDVVRQPKASPQNAKPGWAQRMTFAMSSTSTCTLVS